MANILDFLDKVVISLLVKYYVPLAHINKVLNVLKIKSVVDFSMRRNRDNAFDCEIPLKSMANSLQILKIIILKTFITLLIWAKGT